MCGAEVTQRRGVSLAMPMHTFGFDASGFLWVHVNQSCRFGPSSNHQRFGCEALGGGRGQALPPKFRVDAGSVEKARVAVIDRVAPEYCPPVVWPTLADGACAGIQNCCSI